MRVVSAISVLAICAGTASAQSFYQRATQGATGVTTGSGIAVSNLFFSAWRFEVTDGPIQTTNIGGHFFSGGGSIFGALVELTGPNDDPDDYALTTPDVLGTTLIPLPSGSSNVAQGPLSLTLDNGWYMVVFGSGAFGAAATGTLVAQDPATAVLGAQNNVTYRQASHPSGPGYFVQGGVARVFVEYNPATTSCYANCDESTAAPVLNVSDFGCFLSKFAAGDPYANCDGSTNAPILNVSDFGCFLTKFAAGCP